MFLANFIGIFRDYFSQCELLFMWNLCSIISGRDFKNWVQVAPFILDTFISRDDLELVVTLAEVAKIAYSPAIHKSTWNRRNFGTFCSLGITTTRRERRGRRWIRPDAEAESPLLKSPGHKHRGTGTSTWLLCWKVMTKLFYLQNLILVYRKQMLLDWLAHVCNV